MSSRSEHTHNKRFWLRAIYRSSQQQTNGQLEIKSLTYINSAWTWVHVSAGCCADSAHFAWALCLHFSTHIGLELLSVVFCLSTLLTLNSCWQLDWSPAAEQKEEGKSKHASESTSGSSGYTSKSTCCVRRLQHVGGQAKKKKHRPCRWAQARLKHRHVLFPIYFSVYSVVGPSRLQALKTAGAAAQATRGVDLGTTARFVWDKERSLLWRTPKEGRTNDTWYTSVSNYICQKEAAQMGQPIAHCTQRYSSQLII